MKTINLKLYLIILIILIASVCLLSTATLVLYQVHTKSIHETNISAESIDKQLEVRLVFGRAKGFLSTELFPNFDFWVKSEHSSGLCVRFERPDGKIVKRACRGAKIIDQSPDWFKKIYRRIFQLGHKVKRPVTHRSKIYGFVIVSSNVETELGYAWHDVKTLMKLSLITVISLCTMLYFAVDWAFRPARLIVTGLEKMAQGNLSVRLVDFNITEWQRTGKAINQLTENLEKTLADRNQLAFNLVNAQDQERRYLTRELHDEFGQSLAGLAAVSSSITQSAEKECSQLVAESQHIGRITAHMMDLLKDMLIRLRTVDFDELGLTERLNSMIKEWNTRSGGKTIYEIDIADDFDLLSGTLSITILRIVQECLTNVSKHSEAKKAKVKLEKLKRTVRSNFADLADGLLLTIEDDGIADTIELSDSSGIGLLGIHNRVQALAGKLTFKVNKPSGLIVNVWLPLDIDTES